MKRTNLLTQAIENHEELVRLVNRVLDAITITREFPPVQCETVSIYQIVRDILAHLDPRDVQAYTFHLQLPEQISVWADPQYLCQVLRNLLGNVFKYVPKQTEIRIEAVQATPTSPFLPSSY